MDLTVLIPALNEVDNLTTLVPDVARVARQLDIDFEILVVDGGPGGVTRPLVEGLGGRVIEQTGRGYGAALSEGFAAARGEYVLTMDADYSHEPGFIRTLWENREGAELTIASRYVADGSAETGVVRSVLSRILNDVYRRFLDLPYRDLSSGFRIYRAAGLGRIDPESREFDILPELLVLLDAEGFGIRELPFDYRPRRDGRSRAKLVRFGWAYGKTLLRMRRLRASARARSSPAERRPFLNSSPSTLTSRRSRRGI